MAKRRPAAATRRPSAHVPDSETTLAALVPDPANRRQHNERNLGMLAEALTKLGAARSIVIDERGEVLAGNGVVQAAAAIGLSKVRIVDATGEELIAVRRSGLTVEQERALAMYDNRVAELAEWNVDQLRDDLAHGLDLQPWFSTSELSAFAGGLKDGQTDPDDVPAQRVTSIVAGELFALGSHRLICGDCTDAAILGRVQDEPAALVFTDPPYGIDIVKVEGGKIGGDKPYSVRTGQAGGGGSGAARYPYGGVKDGKTRKGKVGFDNLVAAKQYLPIHGDDRPFDPRPLLALAPAQIIFGANFFASKLPDGKAWIVWDKDASGMFSACELAWTSWSGRLRMYRHMWSGLRRAGPRDEELTARVHPTQKPVGLFAAILGDYAEANAVILDPYAGSGSMLIACERTGRRARLVEFEPAYCQVIIDRWEAFTGGKAEQVL